eukprot:SAG22_NODE_293_length_12891_cov_17.337242_7_plen_122_part_00
MVLTSGPCHAHSQIETLMEYEHPLPARENEHPLPARSRNVPKITKSYTVKVGRTGGGTTVKRLNYVNNLAEPLQLSLHTDRRELLRAGRPMLLLAPLQHTKLELTFAHPASLGGTEGYVVQ